MSQRTSVTASAEKTSANQAATRVKPEQRGQQPAFAQNLLHLQQAVGNRATQGLLNTGMLQTKLRIGPAGDRFEREADRMADTVLRMPAPGAGTNATQVAQVQSNNVQRVCAECEEELRRQPLEEEEDELLQAKASTNASPPVNAGVELHIASLHGGGRPLSPAQRSFFEPRFNHDFSDVRVHTSGTAAESARAIKARAFTVGRDIAFGAGQYAPESLSGRHLLAHELTHTIQQTPLVARRKPLIQRQPETSPGVDSTVGETESQSPVIGPVEQPEQTPAGSETERETPAPGLIVGDETSELGPGQMGKRAFLAELRNSVCAAADQPLTGTQYTAQGCPTIELYLRIYESFTAERIEQDLVRFMPEVAGITDAREYIPLMAARVQRSVAVWVQTGEITGVPEGLPTDLPALSAVGRVLFKARNGGPKGNPNPQAVQTQLGAGQPLNSSVGSRMGSAFGRSFSNVRVHTDASAAHLSNRFNARAFTVGNHVAFGTGEYRPGTLMGDALIAHELAHTVQQGDTNKSVSPLQTGNSGTTALEKDADRSAMGAVVSLWGRAKGALVNFAQNAVPRLRSGLKLQRCYRDVNECPSGLEWQVVGDAKTGTAATVAVGVGCVCKWKCLEPGSGIVISNPVTGSQQSVVKCPPGQSCGKPTKPNVLDEDFELTTEGKVEEAPSVFSWGAHMSPLGGQAACGCFPLTIQGEKGKKRTVQAPMLPSELDVTDLAGIRGGLKRNPRTGVIEGIKKGSKKKDKATKKGSKKKDKGTKNVVQDENTTWNPKDYPSVGSNGLPNYDGKNTLGKIQIDGETYNVKNGKGQPGQALKDDPSVKAGAVSPSHAEGHAASIMKQTGTKKAVLEINNPAGPCGFCDKVIKNMLPEGSELTVKWPNGTQTFIGNAK